MNTPANAGPESAPDTPGAPPAATSAPSATSETSEGWATRPLYWSVRRELWENRAVYVAPLLAACVLLCGFVLSGMGGLWSRHPAAPALDPAQQHAAIVRPYTVAPGLIAVTALLVGIFYSLDALYGERRERTILFWKSLPVSDLTTVLAKASIPLVILPLLVFAIGAATQFIMLLLSTAVLLGSGGSAASLWGELRLLQMPLVLLYGLVTLALWHAPLYGWLLLVSGWARRAPVLWAVLPPLAICAVEKMAFDTAHFASLLGYRFAGSLQMAFDAKPPSGGRAVIVDRLAQLDPARFLSTPGLWIGLAAAAVFLGAAARLRRYRVPI